MQFYLNWASPVYVSYRLFFYKAIFVLLQVFTAIEFSRECSASNLQYHFSVHVLTFTFIDGPKIWVYVAFLSYHFKSKPSGHLVPKWRRIHVNTTSFYVMWKLAEKWVLHILEFLTRIIGFMENEKKWKKQVLFSFISFKVVIISASGHRQKISIKCWKYNRSSWNFTGAFFMLFFTIRIPKCRACWC